jgi:peptidoglycan/LPS O-acetylase OafA/YrhL
MRAHVYPLDALRFFAALSVVAFHLGFYAWSAPNSTVASMLAGATSFPVLAPWTWFGWVGVEIFFVISGFVIANSANGASPIGFAKSRALRLYPAVWICAVFTLCAWVLVDGVSPLRLFDEMARSTTLWITGPWIDGVYWSLAVEMVFYAVIFTLLAAGRFARLSWIAWGLLALSGAYLSLSLVAGEDFWRQTPWRAVRELADILLLRHGCFFALGIFMWLSSVRAISARGWVGAALACVAGCLEIVLRTRELATETTQSSLALSSFVPGLVWLVAIVAMFVFTRAPERFEPVSMAARAALKQVGKMTYPLYLTHAIVGVALLRVMVQLGANPWLALGGALAIVLALSWLVARWGEPFVRNLLRSLWGRGEGSLERASGLAFLFRAGGVVATRALSHSGSDLAGKVL